MEHLYYLTINIFSLHPRPGSGRKYKTPGTNRMNAFYAFLKIPSRVVCACMPANTMTNFASKNYAHGTYIYSIPGTRYIFVSGTDEL